MCHVPVLGKQVTRYTQQQQQCGSTGPKDGAWARYESGCTTTYHLAGLTLLAVALVLGQLGATPFARNARGSTIAWPLVSAFVFSRPCSAGSHHPHTTSYHHSYSSTHHSSSTLPSVAKIGAIFHDNPSAGNAKSTASKSDLLNDDETESEIAFRYAIQRINRDRNILPNTTLIYDVQFISRDDSFHAAKKACQMINNGVLAIFGPSNDRIGVHVQSVCDALDIPHLESRMHNLNIGKEFSINLHPGAYAVAQSIRVLISFLNWTQIAVIYEDDFNLIGMQELTKMPLAKNVQFIYRKTWRDNFRQTLVELREREIYTMIVDIKPENLKSFFTAILQVQMNENRYHYHFTTFDLEIFDLEDFMYNEVNITSYRIVDYSNPMVRTVLKEMDKYHPSTARQMLHQNQMVKASAAMMFDSVYAFARGLHHFYKSYGIPGNVAGPEQLSHASSGLTTTLNSFASCSNETAWANGLSLYNYIDSLSFHGMTGKISFKEGIRSNMKMELLKLRNYRLEKVGEFYHTESLLNITNHEAFVQYRVKNITLRVTTVLMSPYVRRIRNTSSSSAINSDALRYDGYCIDLLDAIAKNLGFNYEIYEVEDGKFGAQDETTGEWQGLVRELMDKRADLAIAPLTINYARESVVDFTKPFINLGIGILFKMPTHTPTRLFSFMSPLAVDIWLYVVAAYVLVSATLFIVARFSPYEWVNPHPCLESDIKENQFSLPDSFWFTVVTLMKQGCDMNPKSFSTRIIGAIWWFFTLILISSYTANLAAFLTVERISMPIDNVDDLASQTKIKYGTLRDGSTMQFFRDSMFPVYRKMWEVMKSNPQNFVDTYKEGEERVLNSEYAFLIESPMIDHMVQRDCRLVQIGGLLDSKGYGIATQMGSEWKDKISLAILELQERGETTMIYDKWWKSSGLTCIRDEIKNKDGKANPLGLDNIGGVFVVLLLGLFISLMTAFLEFLNRKAQVRTEVGATDSNGAYSDGTSSQAAIY